LKIDKSIRNLSRRIDRFDSDILHTNNRDNVNINNVTNQGNEVNYKKIDYWKGRKVISLSEWERIANHTQYCRFGSDNCI
jgi:hypothetical protein